MLNFNLYGVGYDDSKKIILIILVHILQIIFLLNLFGSFGLVWDGMSSETCKGSFGEYLRINNPHKTSLYLASGIPVIIWSKAALAEFIEKNKCGIRHERIRFSKKRSHKRKKMIKKVKRQYTPTTANHFPYPQNSNMLLTNILHSHRRAKVYPILINYCIT